MTRPIATVGLKHANVPNLKTLIGSKSLSSKFNSAPAQSTKRLTSAGKHIFSDLISDKHCRLDQLWNWLYELLCGQLHAST